MGSTLPSQRNAFIDLLRALAIVEVLLHHLVDQVGPEALTKVFRAPVGVQVFLVLSGWLLGGQLLRALARKGRVDVPRFLGRRWLRTLPAYYAVLAVRTLWARHTLPETAGMLVFAQNYLAPDAWVITWSLCVQEYFYLALPLVLLLTGRRPRLGMALGVGTLILSPVLRWYAFRPSMTEGEYFALIEAPTHMRLDGLVLGVVLAACSEKLTPAWTWIRRHPAPLALIGLAVIGVITASPFFFEAARQVPVSALASGVGILGLSFGAALLIPATTIATARPRWWHGPANWTADHAFVMYLLHSSAYGLILPLGNQLHVPVLATAVAAVAATACGGWALRTLIEKPALRARQWLLEPAPQISSSASEVLGAATGHTRPSGETR